MSEETNEFSDRAVRAYETIVDKYTRAMLGDLKLFVKEVYSNEIIEDAQQLAYNKGYSAGFSDGSNEAFEKGRLAGIEEEKKTWLTTMEQDWNAGYEQGAEDMLTVVRKIFLGDMAVEGYKRSELINYFGSERERDIIMRDAMYLLECDRNLKEAREKAHCDPSPIEPGDDVASSDNITTFVVTHVSENLLYGIGPTGGVYSDRPMANWHKTGKHYDMNKFLQMIGGGTK